MSLVCKMHGVDLNIHQRGILHFLVVLKKIILASGGSVKKWTENSELWEQSFFSACIRRLPKCMPTSADVRTSMATRVQLVVEFKLLT